VIWKQVMVMKQMIRRAEPDDVEKIRHIARTTWKATYEGLIPEDVQLNFINWAYSDENLRKRIQGSIFFVAEIEGQWVGFGNAAKKGNHAELSAIYILPWFQNQGIGGCLLSAVVGELVGASEITVDVEAGNAIGERFYQAKGFTREKTFDDLFMGSKLKTCRMVKILQKK
jgi:Acetyltransferases